MNRSNKVQQNKKLSSSFKTLFLFEITSVSLTKRRPLTMPGLVQLFTVAMKLKIQLWNFLCGFAGNMTELVGVE